MTRSTLAIVVGLALGGCGTSEVAPRVLCQSSNSQFLALSDSSPLGFTPLDVLNNTVDGYDVSIAWDDGMTGSLEVSLEFVDGSQRYEERSYNGDPPVGSPPCEDGIVMDMRVVLASQEGRLNDLLTFTGVASTATEMLIAFQLPSSLNGTFDISEFAPSGSAVVSANVELVAGNAAVNGQIIGVADGELFDIATVTTP